MDYSTWSILEARACSKFVPSVDMLKRNLNKTWDNTVLAVSNCVRHDNTSYTVLKCVEVEF